MSEITADTSLTMYVYYKIPTDKHHNYLSALDELNNCISALYPNLEMSRQRRPDLDAEKKELWMEIYCGIPHALLTKFTDDLNSLAEKNFLPQERRHEVFIPL